MNIMDIGKNAKEKVQKTAGSIKDNAKDLKLSKIQPADIKKKMETAASQVKATIKNTPDNIKGVFNKKETDDSAIQDGTVVISNECATKIIYYLMSADGVITEDELEMFEQLAIETDPCFGEKREKLISYCNSRLESAEDISASVKTAIVDALSSDTTTEDSYITPKVLIWNMLTIAYSDNDYSQAEKTIVDSVAETFGIDQAEYLELESSLLTMNDLEKELRWIKTTNKPYLQIETMVNEIQDRKNTVLNSVYELITL